ncbi:conserved exported hypothetical protein [Burkholderia latens]|uniref:hypothetical protein n=1 Tax=Burkholderia latens TaxID=488446 RepID=UPI0039A6FAEA
MKKIVLTIAALVAANAACAQTTTQAMDYQVATLQQLQLLNAQLADKFHGQQYDGYRFCYFDGRPFSLGAVRDGMRCEDTGSHVLTKDGAPDRERSDPLRWIPARVSAKAQ